MEILDKLAQTELSKGDNVLCLISDRVQPGVFNGSYRGMALITSKGVEYYLPQCLVLGSLTKLKDSVISKRAFIVGNINSMVNAFHKLNVRLTIDDYSNLEAMVADALSNDKIQEGDEVLVVWSTDETPLESSKFDYVFDVYKLSDNNYLKLALCSRKSNL